MAKIVLIFFKIFTKALIEIFFPYFCVGCDKKDTLLCESCFEKVEFKSFGFNNLYQLEYLDQVIVVCKYQGIIKKLIYEYKYKSVIDIGKVIAKLIFRSANIPYCNIIISVPIHKSKKSKRGFNQSEEIAKHLSKLINKPSTNLLLKSKNTASQMSIRNRDQRKLNVVNSFEIELNELRVVLINNKHSTVIIVDDVITTGSTLNECAKILKENGVEKVIGLVLAQR